MRAWLIVVALTACHDKEAAPTAGSATPAGSAVAKVRPANAPVLPAEPGLNPSGLAPAQAFEKEQPDPDWAPKTERTLKTRLAKVPDAKITCKQTVCEVAVTGDQMKAVDQIQGLSDLAQNVTLTQDNGELRAYLRFERAD
jgi:hypothetical protein